MNLFYHPKYLRKEADGGGFASNGLLFPQAGPLFYSLEQMPE
jgi:hypothetical protein